MPKSGENFGHPAWFRQREFNQRLSLGHSDAFYKRLYSSFSCVDFRQTPGTAASRGIYSMDFSPDGSLLVAACNESDIQVFDPSSRKLIKTFSNTHGNLVRKVTFLDSHTFATGSVDSTIALWDVRYLNVHLQTLQGHHEMVTNIEFSSQNSILVTFGFDGMIRTWNLNDLTEENIVSKSVFGSHDFEGMRLNPDASKMIINSSRGYLLIVHDLDLTTLADDLAGYNPGRCPLYHLKQMIVCSEVDVYSRSRQRNRVEPVTDFPDADGGSEVTALEVHPEGASVLSRSSTEDATLTHWLSVHDIRAREPAGGEDQADEAEGAAEGRERESAMKSVLEWIESMTLHSGDGPGAEADQREKSAGASTSAPPPEPEEEEVGSHADSSSPQPERQVRRTLPRLTHFVGGFDYDKWRGEELCFSPDGRLICTPYDSGIKLHTFSPECQGQFVSWTGRDPMPLHEFATHSRLHDGIVISTRFSPRHCLIVSGCSHGKINWYQPFL